MPRRRGAAPALLLFAALLPFAATAQAPAMAGSVPPPLPAPGSGAGTLVYNFAQRPVSPLASGQVDVTVETNTAGLQSGYSTLRAFLQNKGKSKALVRLEFNASNKGATLRRDVEVPPASRVTVPLLIPAGVTYGQVVATSDAFENGVGRISVYLQNATNAVLALGTDDQFQTAVQRAPTTTSYDTFVRTLDPEGAPAELAAYVGFNEVVVLVPFEDLTEGARRAVEGYAAVGGTLVVTKPPRNIATYLPLLPGNATGLHPYGFGHVRLCGEDPLTCAYGIADDLPLAQREVKPSAENQTVRAARYGMAAGPEVIPTDERFLLPQATAPVGRFLLIILLFTLAIGPGSVWVARTRGPPMLLLTIPATAAVTCLLIVGYSVLVDGFAIHASTRGYTLLDSKGKRAITVGLTAYYANISPGDARFDLGTALIAPQQGYGGSQYASIDWSQGARFDSDFVPSRTYREWGMVSVAPTRARLMIRPSDKGTGYAVENALGSHVRTVYFVVNGEGWVANDIREGGSREAERTLVAPAMMDGVVEYASRFGARTINRATADVAEGQFLAQVEGPSFLPTGGIRLSLFTSEHLVRGEVAR